MGGVLYPGWFSFADAAETGRWFGVSRGRGGVVVSVGLSLWLLNGFGVEEFSSHTRNTDFRDVVNVYSLV